MKNESLTERVDSFLSTKPSVGKRIAKYTAAAITAGAIATGALYGWMEYSIRNDNIFTEDYQILGNQSHVQNIIKGTANITTGAYDATTNSEKE